MNSVAIYGAGQLGTGVARLLAAQGKCRVLGPFGRSDRRRALTSGATVVLIATTTRFADVAPDIEQAVRHGSNVLVSAEECAFPYAVDRPLAARLDQLATSHGVTIAGCGVNPGLIFDGLVLTLLGALPPDCTISASRRVDISGFGAAVLRRIGIGRTSDEFEEGVQRGDILGHAGFPQSMAVVAVALGLEIERIDKRLEPVIATEALDLPGRFAISAGQSAGVDQTYIAVVKGSPWYTCNFFGHVALATVGAHTSDRIEILNADRLIQRMELVPGIGSQVGSQNMVANSIDRVINARPGWLTVADLVPAMPAAHAG